MRTPLALIASASLVLGLAACGNDDSTSPATDPTTTVPSPTLDLDGRTFLSVELREDGAVRDLVAGTRVRLGFADGALSVAPGCNSGGGSYTVEDGRLVTDAVAMTEMACDEPRMVQDELVLGLLGDRPTITLDGDTLVLATDTLELEMLDREVADPDRPLEGTTWSATTIIDRATATNLPDGVEVTLTFADGKVAGTFGCNRGSGSITVDGATITVGPLMTTKMACDEDHGRVEAHVLSVLDGAVGFEIEAGSLTLTNGDLGLGLTAAEE